MSTVLGASENHIRGGAAAVAMALLLAVGCGKKGPPLPPLPRGPFPPVGAAARQIGVEVFVNFEIPPPRGSKPAQLPARAELLRVTYAPGLQPAIDPDSFRRSGEVVGRAEFGPARTVGHVSIEDTTLGALPEMGLGWTLRYAVRVRDRKGRRSPLVVTEDLVPLPLLPPPQALEGTPTADGVRLSWRSVAVAGGDEDAEARTFNIYRAPAGGAWPARPLNTDPVSTTEYLDTEIEVGRRYRYEIRAALSPGRPYREGDPGESIEVLAADRFAPAPPEAIVGVQEGVAVRLFWDPSDERDLGGYRVYRSVDGGAWEALSDDIVERPQYLDKTVRVGQRATYRVTAVDRASPPNESEPSALVEVDLLPEPDRGGEGER
jgi:hypothetical protein